jgi:LuxR family transcriptional regulator, maltose regulon positive regulatory protein
VNSKASIVIVDDHPIFRNGLRVLLEKENDFTVIGEAEDGQSALEIIQELRPDIVVMDISMPNMDGIEATRQLLKVIPELKVVALSVNSGKRFVMDMLRAGASGYILKESVPEEMVRGIRTVLSGDVFLSASISGIVVSEYKRLIENADMLDNTDSREIIRTKFYRPPLGPDIVMRNTLMRRLEEGHSKSVILVSAPTGYGKSTLVSSWLESYQHRYAWLSLDENDNDLLLFLKYFITAIQNLVPDALRKTQLLTTTGNLPPLPLLVSTLINELDDLDTGLILVLDDFHLIRNQDIHKLFFEMLKHPPRTLQLILLCRYDPNLPIASLLAKNELFELRLKDLRFSEEEAQQYFDNSMDKRIDKSSVALMQKKTEGWITGMRLALLALRSRTDGFNIETAFQQRGNYALEYLFNEVFSNQDENIQEYLLHTCIPDRFNAALCSAIMEPAGTPRDISSEDFILYLKENNLFIIALDAVDSWFRYHHLFRQLLTNQMDARYSPEKISGIHKKASAWYVEEGLIGEAIKHSLYAERADEAVHIVETNIHSALNDDKWYILEKWLGMLPVSIVDQRPLLLIAKAWVEYFRFNQLDIPNYLSKIESMLESFSGQQSLSGDIAFFKGYIALIQDDGASSLQHTREALDLIPPVNSLARGEAEIIFGLAGQMEGEAEEGFKLLHERLYSGVDVRNIEKTRVLAAFIFMRIISGKLIEASSINADLERLAEESDYTYARAWAAYLRGLMFFYMFDPDAAIYNFEVAVDKRYILNDRAGIDSIAGLILSYEIAGRHKEAAESLNILSDYADSNGDPYFHEISESLRARLSILSGDTEYACRWVRNRIFPGSSVMLFWLEIPELTRCFALVAEGSDQSLRQAESEIDTLLRMNQRQHNIFQSIRLLLLSAVVLSKLNRESEAFQPLEKALELSEADGIILPFVELGKSLYDLLRKKYSGVTSPDFVMKILRNFDVEKDAALSSEGYNQAVAAQTPGSTPPPEPLTNREIDILQLLSQRLQTKEIAEQLFISPQTVKSHLKRIYRKLDASGRRNAVQKAADFGIIKPS